MCCLALQPGLCTGFVYRRQGDQCGAIRAFKDPFRWNPKARRNRHPQARGNSPLLLAQGTIEDSHPGAFSRPRLLRSARVSAGPWAVFLKGSARIAELGLRGRGSFQTRRRSS
jgi:hypothetical protein